MFAIALATSNIFFYHSMSFQGSKSIPGEYYDLELAKSSSINSPAKEREQAISTCPDKEFIKQPR